jgi:hypothetical protein
LPLEAFVCSLSISYFPFIPYFPFQMNSNAAILFLGLVVGFLGSLWVDIQIMDALCEQFGTLGGSVLYLLL